MNGISNKVMNSLQRLKQPTELSNHVVKCRCLTASTV